MHAIAAPSASRDDLELGLGELVALPLGEHQHLLGDLARLRLLAQLGAEVIEINSSSFLPGGYVSETYGVLSLAAIIRSFGRVSPHERLNIPERHGRLGGASF